MKKISYLFGLFIVITFNSCDQSTSSSGKDDNNADNRPKDELAFVKLINDAYDNTTNQINDVNKKDVADSSKLKITHFIIDSLKTNIKDWQVTVFDINVESMELDGGIDLQLLISKKAQLPEKDPQYDAIILKTHIVNNDTLKTMLKPLQTGDKVLITGKFSDEKDFQGNIQWDVRTPGVIHQEYIFDNPIFTFNISDIKKEKVKQ